MDTILRGSGTEVVISPDRPAVIIGNWLDVRRRQDLVAALEREDMTFVAREAAAQAEAGANVIGIYVGGVGVDEVEMLPRLVDVVTEAVPLPVSIEADDPAALAAALETCPGRPLVSSVTTGEFSLGEFLPLAVDHGAAVLGLAREPAGVPKAVDDRVELARHTMRMIITAGIDREDVVIDPVTLPLEERPEDVTTLLETIAQVRQIEDINVAASVGVVSKGLPNGDAVEALFVAMVLEAGATCLVGDPAQIQRAKRMAEALLRGEAAIERYVEAVKSNSPPGEGSEFTA